MLEAVNTQKVLTDTLSGSLLVPGSGLCVL